MGLVLYLVFFLIVVTILGILTLGLNLQWGFTGLFNAGVVGFYAVADTPCHSRRARPPGTNRGFRAALDCGPGRRACGIRRWRDPCRGSDDQTPRGLPGHRDVRVRHNPAHRPEPGNADRRQPGPHCDPPSLEGTFTTPLGDTPFYLALTAGFGLVILGAGAGQSISMGAALKAIREDEVAAIAPGKTRLLYGCRPSCSAPPSWAWPALFMSASSDSSALSISCQSSRFRSGPADRGGSGNNKGALLGTLIVWGLWSASGTLISKVVPAAYQTQGGAIQAILIGLVLVLTLLFRPRGLIGEEPVVSRHVT